ncbi:MULTISPECIES: RES family NAD+ phosphorylase [unclassified Mesorhizobium]|uniref:RES family NAD+ phosphorylase n=1 Tax=unclassified Mesorhizobium TaxID=325217 RepID=UPI00112CA66B|nr:MULTISPECIES: RES family NAD+ phosphorylase [unclassified Mesorhizobium]TPJ52075.1 RES domain-containing protein [Mesorhizobium sp. B2-6-4]TPK38494.1 RES domain-containing protein [Mesorhizobium sp. B2-5-3]
MRLWRISNFADLSGRGGMLSSGRWNIKGTAIVYCADHPATALLEILVHVDVEDLPPTFQLLEIEVPDGVSIAVRDLPEGWKDNPAKTREIGSDFVSAASHPVMEVPCVIVPFARNYILNPALLEREGIAIVGTTSQQIDTRLLE